VQWRILKSLRAISLSSCFSSFWPAPFRLMLSCLARRRRGIRYPVRVEDLTTTIQAKTPHRFMHLQRPILLLPHGERYRMESDGGQTAWPSARGSTLVSMIPLLLPQHSFCSRSGHSVRRVLLRMLIYYTFSVTRASELVCSLTLESSPACATSGTGVWVVACALTRQ